MDCAKFEPLLLDELYEELDEVTSAAVKRHVSGCARCASVLNGMRSTRRATALPMLEMPDGLEDRILSSVKEAQKVVPIQNRASRALSWAGSWAMRPQTAMAAVFLLMIGTSAFVLRSRPSNHVGSGSGEQAAAVSVTEKGEPAGQAPPSDEHDSLDNKAAAAAHGANMPRPSTLPPTLPAASGALALNTDAVERRSADPTTTGLMDGITGGKGRAPADDSKALASALAEDRSGKDKEDTRKQEESRRGDVEKKVAQRPAPRQADFAGAENAAAPAGAPQQEYAPSSQAVAPPPAARGNAQGPQDGFSAGMAAYRARNFGEAQRQFDAAARSGDQNAELWAAKSVKDGSGGCGAAMGRFDAVASKSAGTWLGNEATLEAARCQIAMDQAEAARGKLTKLIANAPSHAREAQQALNELNKQVASRAERGGGGAARAAPAPVRAPAKPAATTKASGF